MTTKHGSIWAQAVWWNSTSFTKTRVLNFAAPRHISIYSALSSYTLLPPNGSNLPWICSVETGIVSFVSNGQAHPAPGEEFDTPLPYLQADNVTQVKLRLRALLVGDGSTSIRAVHVINFFDQEG